MPGHGEVERVRRLARLEEDVGVLGRAAHDRARRASGPRARRASTSSSRISARRSSSSSTSILLISCEVRKPSKKCRNGTRDSQRRGVRDQREVVRLLHRARRRASPSRSCAACHHVAVVAEDRQRVGGDRAGGDVDHGRRQLAGDLEHVRDHQQQALRRGEGRRQRALLQRAVQRAGGARLGLHLDDVRDLAPEVRPACGRPVVAVLAHRRGRRDRIDRDHLAHGVGDASGGLVAVQALVAAGPRAAPLGIGWARSSSGWRESRPSRGPR